MKTTFNRLMPIFAFIIIFTFLLSACGSEEPDSKSEAESTPSTAEILSEITDTFGLSDGAYYRSESKVEGEYLDEDMISSYYGSMFDAPDFSLIEEYAIYMNDKNPLLPIEIGIFKVKDRVDNDMIVEFVSRRKDAILQNAINYPSVDTDPFKNLVLETKGNYTYYIAVKENRTEITNLVQGYLG